MGFAQSTDKLLAIIWFSGQMTSNDEWSGIGEVHQVRIGRHAKHFEMPFVLWVNNVRLYICLLSFCCPSKTFSIL